MYYGISLIKIRVAAIDCLDEKKAFTNGQLDTPSICTGIM